MQINSPESSHEAFRQAQIAGMTGLVANVPAVSKGKVNEALVLTSARSRVIIGSLDVLVDIGVPAEKEVIQ